MEEEKNAQAVLSKFKKEKFSIVMVGCYFYWDSELKEYKRDFKNFYSAEEQIYEDLK